MKDVLFLHTSRDEYSANECSKGTMTVGELIEELRRYDEDLPIMFCNDNGYTYGYISDSCLAEDEIETEEDERREEIEEEIEEWEAEKEYIEEKRNEDITDLDYQHENAKEGDEDYLTDEEYRAEVERINIEYDAQLAEAEGKIAELKRELDNL